MEEHLNKITKKWYKKKRWILIIVAIIGVVVWGIFFRGETAPVYEKITAQRSDLIQEVSVTGKIKPAQAVDLQFESSGRIASINYKVGSRVNSGAVIASLANQDLQASVTSAEADLEKTIRNFNSLADPSVSSTLRVELENAKSNLNQVQIKAVGDLATKYSNASSTLNEAMSQIKGSSNILEYIRKKYFENKGGVDDDIKSQQIQINSKIQAVMIVYPNIGQSGSSVSVDDYNKIDLALQEMLGAYQIARTSFTFLQSQMQSNSLLITLAADRTSINAQADSIATKISAISTAVQNIIDQNITNNKNINDAEAKLATAEASFPTSEDILQKQAALSSAQSLLRKSRIIAPFTGIIGKVDVELGQTVSATNVIVSLVSAANYQIEANITEIDIGKIKVGDSAVLTLDAFDSQLKFNAMVSTVDTSATIVEGVTTYKTIFDFNDSVEASIRPNMTANIDIQTNKKENVITVPQRAVITKNGDRVVRIYKGEGIPLEERIVQLGLTGRNGHVEILSGILEGEQVVTFIND